jgi:UPF0716 protein FxsA
MLLRLLLLFTLVPLIELSLLMKISDRIHLGPTIALVIVTGVIGTALARHEGLRTFNHIRVDLNAGRLPADRLVDALLILVAGVLLVTPGILTDGVGFLLLLPPFRSLIRQYLKKRFQSKFVIMHPGGFADRPPDDDLIDVEAHPRDES